MPTQEELEEMNRKRKMDLIGQYIEEMFPGTGFFVMLYPHNASADAIGKYVSNSRREDVKSLMRKMIKNWK